MPDFALYSPDVEYGLASRVRILRPYVQASFLFPSPPPRTVTCFLDTGAAVSVVSRGVAQLLPGARPVAVPDPFPRFVGGQPAGTVPAASLLTWDGFGCELLDLDLSFANPRGEVAGPLPVLAKVPLAPRPAYFNDLFVILGMHFLAASRATVALTAASYGVGGTLTVP